MTAPIDLETPVNQLYMVGESYAKKLAKLEIFTAGDLIYHYPVRYEDFSLILPINKLAMGKKVTVKGEVVKFDNIYTRFGKRIQKGQLADATGRLEFIFFNQPYLITVLRKGITVSLAGTVDADGYRLRMKSPEYELLQAQSSKLKSISYTVHTGRLVPIYPETAGVSSKWLRSRIAWLILKNAFQVVDWLPLFIQKGNQLCPLDRALKYIHFPVSSDQVKQARNRLGFDELYLIQLEGLRRRQEWQTGQTATALKPFPGRIRELIQSLPFTLTEDQRKVIKALTLDLSRPVPANRLIQGDVGAGKTVVAATAIYLSFLNQQFSLLMAPTEILAKQHFDTLKRVFAKTKLKVNLVTAGQKKVDPKANLLIGTHALLFRSFPQSPALVIIDEQHRFGVSQRGQLLNFIPRPHLVTMSATPIPRTMTLAFYGDLDVSYIKQMPKGIRNVKTWVVPHQKRTAAYQWIKKQIDGQKAQVFIVCPLIDESEHEKLKDIKAVTQEFTRLSSTVFPEYKLALLHGRIEANKKNTILSDFRSGKYDILVSTPVIEVGIDIPRASIIVIEGAERFGLAQMHQLRGRVGRMSQESFCLLFTTGTDNLQNRRLKAMEKHFSGFALSEIDLTLRGPGEIYGRKQSGFKQLKIASLTDNDLTVKTRLAAEKTTPVINQFPLLQEKLKKLTIIGVEPN